MTRRLTNIILCTLFLTTLTIRFISVSLDHTKEYPKAQQGTLDLREWNFREQGLVDLSGEWEFYDHQLYSDIISSASDSSSLIVNIPRNWNFLQTDHEQSTPSDYGTFHLKVLIQDPHPLYGIKISDIRSAHTLYVNGRRMTEGNSPAPNIPYDAYFQSEDSVIDLFIAVSRQEGQSGGFLQSLKFGLQHQISEYREDLVRKNLILSTIYLVIGSSFIFVYLFCRKYEEVLSIGLYLLLFAVFMATSGEKLIYRMIPGLDYGLGVRIQALSFIGMIYAFLRLVSSVCGQLIYRWFTRTCLVLIVIQIFICLFAPVYILSELEIPIVYFFIIINIGAVIALLNHVTMKHSHYLLINCFGIIYQAVDFLYYLHGRIGVDQVTILGQLVSFLAMLILISKLAFVYFIKAEKLSEQFMQINQIKDEFLANTSHELRTPLHGIINIAQSLIDDQSGSLNDEHKYNLGLIISVGRRMAHLLNDILDLSKLETGNIRLKIQTVHLHSLVSSALEVMQYLVGAKDIKIYHRVADHLPPVFADEHRLMQILINLIHNAIKFTPAGEISIRAELRQQWLEIQVSDSGIGIPEQQQRNIFDGFVQGQQLNDHTNGAGLGLSICKKLVELHGGEIGVESVEGQGTTFYFTLPISNESIAPGIDQETARQLASTVESKSVQLFPEMSYQKKENDPGEGKHHILVVEDNPINVHIILQLLSEEKHKISVLTTGEAVIAELQRRPDWDLVILDAMLPQMSGYEVCRRLRKQFPLFELPVLMLTARSQPGDLVAGFQAGANDYVIKPVDGNDLRARVQTLLRMKSAVIEHIRMETALLQAQIRPHFLYNTLNTIASLISVDPKQARELIVEFGHYLRASFNSHNLDHFVSIKTELSLIESYLFIEQARFGSRLNFKLEIQDGLHFRIPPLTLQPLVENAVRHGIMKRIDGGSISIRIVRDKDQIVITIADNGVGMTEDRIAAILEGRTGSGIGLRNTNRRLRHYYGDVMTIKSAPQQGTIITIRMQGGVDQ